MLEQNALSETPLWRSGDESNPLRTLLLGPMVLDNKVINHESVSPDVGPADGHRHDGWSRFRRFLLLQHGDSRRQDGHGLAAGLDGSARDRVGRRFRPDFADASYE